MGAYSLLDHSKAIVFFDTHCLLCNYFVRILVKNDRQQLYYSGFDNAIAKELLPLRLRRESETIVLIENGELYYKSIAVFKILGYLRQPWPMLKVFQVFPLSWNNYLYDWIARNRMRWFGRSNTCLLPTTEHKIFFD